MATPLPGAPLAPPAAAVPSAIPSSIPSAVPSAIPSSIPSAVASSAPRPRPSVRARAPSPRPPLIVRIHLTNAQKLAICEHSAANPSLSLDEIALWTKKRFRLKKPVSTSTVYHALRKHETLKQLGPRELEAMTLRKNAVVEQFQTRLRDWIVQMAERGLHLDCKIIQAEAQRLRAEMDTDGSLANRSFSNGWLASFMLRNGLSLTQLRKGGSVVAPNRKPRVNKKRATPVGAASGAGAHPTY